MKKIKVVWLCHFSNDEIKRMLNTSSKLNFAPWISDLIQLSLDKSEMDIHIIAPNYFTNKNISFDVDGIKYHFYKYNSFYLNYKLKDISYNYLLPKKQIEKIIRQIKPEIIHLHGSENPSYSIGILPFLNKYPILLTIQGFISLSKPPRNVINRYIRWNRIRIEKKINSQVKNITAATDDVSKVLKDQNITARIYSFHYPTTIPQVSAEEFKEKKYDIVFSARITKDKGIEDLIKAIRIIKKTRPDIKAIIIGGGSSSYVKEVKKIILENDLNNNIIFAGYQPTQQDVFKLTAQARVSVLPTYFDGLPGSIREAMFMKLPVVAYAVGGIPTLNDEKECITLVEKHNITKLVEKILLVLENKKRTEIVIENAYDVITHKYGNDRIYDNLLNIYNDILRVEEQK